jgi:CheY-like chemotaxis protein
MSPVTATILLVEDDENDVFLVKRAMQKAGVVNPIRVASSGQEAIDYFQGTGKFADRKEFPLPCLVLLDLKLPRVMGLDVIKWIRQQPEVSAIVIVLTSSKDDADIAAAYRHGANGYLVKPSDVAQLTDMARAIKDYWLTQNTPPPGIHEAMTAELPASVPQQSENTASTLCRSRISMA